MLSAENITCLRYFYNFGLKILTRPTDRSAYNNILKSLKRTRRALVRVLMKNYSTNNLFNKIKISTLEKLSIIKVFMNKSEYEYNNTYNTIGENSGNLKFLK